MDFRDFSLYHIFISDARRGDFVRRAGFYQFFKNFKKHQSTWPVEDTLYYGRDLCSSEGLFWRRVSGVD